MQFFLRAVSAPLLLCAAATASAHSAPDDHAPAGVMQDHSHKAGEFMLGLRLSRDWSGGAMRAGTTDLTDEQVAVRGYTAGVRSMTMDMAMLDIMYAPTDWLTLMAMPMYMKMDMVMVGLPAAAADDAHAGHAMEPGMTMSHGVSGFSDTMLSATFTAHRSRQLNLLLTLGLSAPTGSVSRKGADGSFLHYMMQPGSGTWDFAPSLTVTGRDNGSDGGWGWGAQAGALIRTSHANSSGYALGDRFTATAWGSRRIAPFASLSARLAWRDEGAIRGHYNAGHHHSSPPDLQPNYGGRRLDLGIGVNLVATGGPLRGARLGVEWLKPAYNDVNGVQLPQTDSLQLNLSRAF